MPRLVRRKPFIERVKDFVNPADFLLWLSEEIETRDWDTTKFATPVALALHVTLLIARANSGNSRGGGNDVFGDEYSGSGWLSYIVSELWYKRRKVLTYPLGFFHCVPFDYFFGCQRRIHIHSKTALPFVRELHRNSSKYSLSTSSSGWLFACLFLAPTIAYVHTWRYKCWI